MQENSFLKQLYSTSQVPTPHGDPVKLDSQVSRAEGQLIARLIEERRLLRTIEIGCRYGVSTHYICEALRSIGGTEHVIIDNGQRLGVKNVGLWNVLNAGYGDLVSLYNEQSQLTLPTFVERGRRFDFALVDGAHTFDHTLVDFFFIDKILKIGGLIAFDDADWPGIRKVCSFVARNRHYKIAAYVNEEVGRNFFETGSSMVVFEKLEDDLLPQTRKWDYFVEF